MFFNFLKKDNDEHEYVDDRCKELTYNPRYEELWTPKCGPENPMVSEHHKAIKNTLTGFVEKTAINDFQFDAQRKTFTSYGYAIDPSAQSSGDIVIGNTAEASDKNRKLTKKCLNFI